MTSKNILLFGPSGLEENTTFQGSDLEAFASTVAMEATVDILGMEDFSSIQGEACICIEVTGRDEEVDLFLQKSRERGFRVVDADAEVGIPQPSPEFEEGAEE